MFAVHVRCDTRKTSGPTHHMLPRQVVIVLGAVGMIVVECPTPTGGIEGARRVLDVEDFLPSRAGAGLQLVLAGMCTSTSGGQSICATPAKDGVVLDEAGQLMCLRPAGVGAHHALHEATPVRVPDVFLTSNGVMARHVQIACNDLAVTLLQMPGDGVPTVCVLGWDGSTRFSGWPGAFIRPVCLRMWPGCALFAVADMENVVLTCGLDGVLSATTSFAYYPTLFAPDTSDGGLVTAAVDWRVPTLCAMIRKFLPGTSGKDEAWCVTGPAREPLFGVGTTRRNGIVGLDVLPGDAGDAGVVVCDEGGHRIWTIRPYILRFAWLGVCVQAAAAS